LLTGTPDELLRLPNGWLHILDYKTARYTEGQDDLLPMYRTQLNAYALNAEKLDMGKVVGLALMYFEPQTDIKAEGVDGVVKKDGFDLRFQATVVKIDLDLQTIPTLLKEARRIFDLPKPPEGRAGCRDCQLVERMTNLLSA